MIINIFFIAIAVFIVFMWFWTPKAEDDNKWWAKE